MVDLHAFVVSRELGFSNLKSGRALPAALKNGPPLQPVNPSTSGGLDKSVILEVIQSANPAIKACFEEELWRAGRTSDSLFVALSVSAVIGSTGAVTTAEVPSATEKFDALESCVANVHRSLVFPPPIGGGVVTYDFPYFLVPAER
jgi:hypothetical protein